MEPDLSNDTPNNNVDSSDDETVNVLQAATAITNDIDEPVKSEKTTAKEDNNIPSPEIPDSDGNTLVLKIKMKGIIMGGMLCYINLDEQKSVKADSIATAGGTLLAQFEIQRAHNILQDIIFAIKFRGEKYDQGYTEYFNEVLLEDINRKETINNIIRLAKENNIQGITDLLTDIFKYNITSFFELNIELEWIKFDLVESDKMEAEIESLYKNAFDVSLVSDPINGTIIYDLKKGTIIYVKFEDKSPMGLQIKKHLQNIAKRDDSEGGSPELIATVKELVKKDETTVKQMQVIVEITNEIYGKSLVPLSLKVKKYQPKQEVYQTALQEIKKSSEEVDKDGSPREDDEEESKPQAVNPKGCIISIIAFFIIAFIIALILR